MTLALCVSCGALKHGAILPCQDCGAPASGNHALDIALSDHYLSEGTLRSFGRILQRLRAKAQDDGISFWAFMQYLSTRYPEIAQIDSIPKEHCSAVESLLKEYPCPPVIIEDSQRLDKIEGSDPDARWSSRVRHRLVHCHVCGNAQSFPIWSRVNASMDPWVEELLLDGRMFASTCETCGAQQPMLFHTTYLDPDKNLVVWCAPDCTPDLALEPAAISYLLELDADQTFRRVTTPLGLLEKIRIFSDIGDDILVEIVKMIVRIQGKIGLSGALYCLGAYDDELAFLHMTASGTEMIRSARHDQMTELRQLSFNLHAALRAKGLPWPVVDKDVVSALIRDTGAPQYFVQ